MILGALSFIVSELLRYKPDENSMHQDLMFVSQSACIVYHEMVKNFFDLILETSYRA